MVYISGYLGYPYRFKYRKVIGGITGEYPVTGSIQNAVQATIEHISYRLWVRRFQISNLRQQKLAIKMVYLCF